MVKRVEKISFEAQPETEFSVKEMGEDTTKQTDEWLSKIIDRRNLQWIHGGGSGEFENLAAIATEKFRGLAPRCDRVCCEMHIEVQAYTGNGDECVVSLECPLIQEESEEKANAEEAKCLETHESVKLAFMGFVSSTMVSIKAVEARIAETQAQLTSDNRLLDEAL